MTRRMGFDFKKAGWSTNYLEFKKNDLFSNKILYRKKKFKVLKISNLNVFLSLYRALLVKEIYIV